MAAASDWLRQPRPMCGGCKATGIKHVWNAQADLVPAEPRQPCPSCNGSGWSGSPYDNEQDAAEAADNGRNTGGKSYR